MCRGRECRLSTHHLIARPSLRFARRCSHPPPTIKLSALSAKDMRNFPPAVAWIEFLHNVATLENSYSIPFSWGEALQRMNENGAVYLGNYIQVILACAIGVMYKRIRALAGLAAALTLYQAGKRLGPAIEKSNARLHTVFALFIQIAVWMILSLSTATAVVAYAILVGVTGAFVRRMALTCASPERTTCDVREWIRTDEHLGETVGFLTYMRLNYPTWTLPLSLFAKTDNSLWPARTAAYSSLDPTEFEARLSCEVTTGFTTPIGENVPREAVKVRCEIVDVVTSPFLRCHSSTLCKQHRC